jgi:uncharacterized protein
MSTLDRLRELVRGTGRSPATATTPPSPRAAAPIRELVYEPVDESTGLPMPSRIEAPALPGASLVETALGRCVLIEHVFEQDRLHGTVRVADGQVSPGDVIAFCEAQALALDADLSNLNLLDGTSDEEGAGGPAIFLDLETTGLSGGAGTVAFLVGCGFFQDGAFRTQQFLLPGFASERALLHAVAACLGGAGCLVTYNGRTFDIPVMETRWLFHRQPLAWTDLTHLDMLHVSRRLWRARGEEPEASCRLVFLERDLFGVERYGDVPGYEIPARYFDYVRRGDATLLEPVLHHNRMDLLSLALLTARAIALVREGLAADATSPLRDGRISAHEWLAVGRELLRLNQPSRAEACFRAVADAPDATDHVRADALYVWARLLRRGRRYAEAAEVWRRLVACKRAKAVLRAEAREALAVHYEHRDRDLDAAHQWASEAYETDATHGQREALAHRLARLQRKMSVRTKGGPETAFMLPWPACD